MKLEQFEMSVFRVGEGLKVGQDLLNAKSEGPVCMGQCGMAYECSGGGGQCGMGYNCGGGGGKCGMGYNCSGS